MSEYQPFTIDLNLEEVEAWSGEQRPLLPVGTYHVEVANITQEDKYIAVEFRVLEGEHADGRAWNNYMLGTKPGQARLKQLLIACGASLQHFNSDELVGQKLYVDVVHSVGKARVNDMGEPMEPKTFANVQNERAQLAEMDGAEDPEPPPITRQAAQPAPAPAAQPAQEAAASGARRGRRA